MYRVVAGLEIDPTDPAYHHVLVQPQPGGGLTSVDASLETPYGEAASAWALQDDDHFTVSAVIPPNTRGTVRLPGAVLAEVTESGEAVATAPGVRAATQQDGVVVVEVVSGSYRFSYPAGDLVARLRPPRFSVDENVGVLLSSEAAAAVIEKHLPRFADDPVIAQWKKVSLRRVAETAGLSKEALEALDEELRQLRE
jgi:alpha-L-rhamnosidase